MPFIEFCIDYCLTVYLGIHSAAPLASRGFVFGRIGKGRKLAKTIQRLQSKIKISENLLWTNVKLTKD